MFCDIQSLYVVELEEFLRMDEVASDESLRSKIVELAKQNGILLEQNGILLEKIVLLEQENLRLKAMLDKNSGKT
jgi:hypothetical protein